MCGFQSISYIGSHRYLAPQHPHADIHAIVASILFVCSLRVTTTKGNIEIKSIKEDQVLFVTAPRFICIVGILLIWTPLIPINIRDPCSD
ncbi:hypothetical protein J6590_090304 [Homalodisca vitripennis]|nr:hypothetical protein J6590_090304 [Homalodisca vitripennis]